MASVHIPQDWQIRENDLTPESVYFNRREFLKRLGIATAYSALWSFGCTPSGIPSYKETPLTELEKSLYPAQRNPEFILDRPLTSKTIAAQYNNFYEFSDNKQDVSVHAQALPTRPWAVEVTGKVRQPLTLDIDDLLKTMPIEERLYRFRCVEAWAMAVPWTGFPLNALLNKAEPLKTATHVRFTTFYKPFTAQGQLAFWNPWPYQEGLTLEEAMHPLTLMAVGIYGRPLPKQHGAPLRLVVPWKYGFKSIKSVVRIECLDYRPATFWNTLQGLEYDFTANVNPTIPHPRWSQAKETLIGTQTTLPTQIYNGYQPWVGSLYI